MSTTDEPVGMVPDDVTVTLSRDCLWPRAMLDRMASLERADGTVTVTMIHRRIVPSESAQHAAGASTEGASVVHPDDDVEVFHTGYLNIIEET